MRWPEMPDRVTVSGNAASAGRGAAPAPSNAWRSFQWIAVRSAPVSTRNSIGALTAKRGIETLALTSGLRQASPE